MRTDSVDIGTTFEAAFKAHPAVISTAPGRVNLIGEHTDYNEGFVLPLAIDRRVQVAASARTDRKVRVYSTQYQARDEWRVDSPRRTGRAEWRDYVRGVAWALLDARYEIGGADLAIAGDVPPGAGLSSSAALEVAVAGAFCAVSGIEIERRELALICQKAENQFVGVQCGIMDQLATAVGQAGSATLIDCRSLAVKNVPLPLQENGMTLVIVDSKVPRRLSETPYNERRAECAEAARLLGVRSLRDAAESDVDRLGEPLDGRARHVIRENARLLSAVEALTDGHLLRVGDLMYESHESLRRDFEVSCAELDRLVELARNEGAIGSRLTGAGFGGCTINLIRTDDVEMFKATVVGRYASETGLPAEVLVCNPSSGLEVSGV